MLIFRRGNIYFLAQVGASLEDLRVHGDWWSDSIFRYLKTALTVGIITLLQQEN